MTSQGRWATPLYELYRVWFLSRFGLKTSIDFDHYGLKSGMVFKGNTRAYKPMNSKEREATKIYYSS